MIDWLYSIHQQASQHIHALPDYSADRNIYERALKAYKKENVPMFLASGFGKVDDPDYPKQQGRKVRDNGGILRDFVAIDYDIADSDQANKLVQNVKQYFIEDHPSQFALYPSSRYPIEPRFRLVVLVNRILDKSTYALVANALIDELGVDTNDLTANKTIAHNFNAPAYTDALAPKQAIFQTDGPIFAVENLNVDLKPKKKQSRKAKVKELNQVSYRHEQLEPAISAFINDPENQEKLQDYDYFWHFAESLADAKIRNLVSDDFIDETLQAVALGNHEWEQNNKQVFNSQVTKLQNNPEKRELVQPLSSYLPIISQVKQNNPNLANLAQLLKSLLPSNFEGQPDTEIKDAADIISQYFEFALLPTGNSDVDRLAIFNPLSGLWVHNEDDFIAMLTLVKPALSRVQIQQALLYWAGTANLQNRQIKPYAGSQYLIFLNGVLDVTDLTLYPLDSDLVKGLQFTQRHQIQINYDPDAKLKTFEGDGTPGTEFEDWNIENFIRAYANNDDSLRTYLLFGLSLGLFAGHNSGVHFDIQGDSGSGKSTLADIYRGLFGPNRVASILFPDLNKDFPLTNYDPNTAIIWIREANTNTNPLDEDHGTPFYDSLTDNTARLPVKHGGDMILDNPPQVYVDGTQLIQSTDLKTGPARRTLAFKLPSPIEQLRPQYYSNSIFERLTDEEVLQYLVNQMIAAFREIVPANRQLNFKMNLGIRTDVLLLPPKAQAWRQEFVSADENMRGWFNEMIAPSIMTDGFDTYINDEMMYRLYLGWYTANNPQDNTGRFARRKKNFTEILHQIYEEDGYRMIEYMDSQKTNRRKLATPEKWGFNWSVYDENFLRPAEFRSATAWPEVYQKKATNLYRLVKGDVNPELFTKLSEIHFVPKQSTVQTVKLLKARGDNVYA